MWNREPVAITEAVRAIIALAVAFGLDWTGEQVAAVIIAVGAVLAVITRAKVTPTTGTGLGSVSPGRE